MKNLMRLGVTVGEEYRKVISGAADTDTYKNNNQLLDDVEGGFDHVVVYERSRLSSLGPTEIHEFIELCLDTTQASRPSKLV